MKETPPKCKIVIGKNDNYSPNRDFSCWFTLVDSNKNHLKQTQANETPPPITPQVPWDPPRCSPAFVNLGIHMKKFISVHSGHEPFRTALSAKQTSRFCCDGTGARHDMFVLFVLKTQETWAIGGNIILIMGKSSTSTNILGSERSHLKKGSFWSSSRKAVAKHQLSGVPCELWATKRTPQGAFHEILVV